MSSAKRSAHVSPFLYSLYDVFLIVVEAFEIQPGSELAAEISEQLAAAEVLALQNTKLTSNEGTKLSLVSRNRIANATFTSSGSIVIVRGTCNQDGFYVCISRQGPPTLPGPYEFFVEDGSIRVYRLKQLVWQCGE